jgi:hypothetical protein
MLAFVGWFKPAPWNSERTIQTGTQASLYESLAAVPLIATELSRAAEVGGC